MGKQNCLNYGEFELKRVVYPMFWLRGGGGGGGGGWGRLPSVSSNYVAVCLSYGKSSYRELSVICLFLFSTF